LREGARVDAMIFEHGYEFSTLSAPGKGRNFLRPPLWADLGKTRQSTTALACALENRRYAAMRLLIQRGADVQKRIFVFGRSVSLFQYACALGDVSALKILLFSKNPGDLRQLLKTATSYRNVKTVRYLLARRADPNATVNGTPIWFLADTPRLLGTFFGHGANPGATDHLGRTYLFFHMLGEYANMKLFLSKGGKVRGRDREGKTLLHYAAGPAGPRFPYIVAKTLIKAGARLNARDEKGITPLMEAAQVHKNTRIIRLLLASGANAALKNNREQTALDYAKELIDNQAVLRVLGNKRKIG